MRAAISRPTSETGERHATFQVMMSMRRHPRPTIGSTVRGRLDAFEDAVAGLADQPTDVMSVWPRQGVA
jgi:hypothetical protein